MKYAFIIGTNAFIVPSRVISYGDHDDNKEFLRINAIHHDLPATAGNQFLDIDLNVSDTTGAPIVLIANKLASAAEYSVSVEPDNIKVQRTDGSTLVQVHQLRDDDAMDLEHNIAAELEVNAPVVVIRITGDFMLGDLHILAENEKLFINENGYATSAMIGKNQLKFTTEGVEL